MNNCDKRGNKHDRQMGVEPLRPQDVQASPKPDEVIQA